MQQPLSYAQALAWTIGVTAALLSLAQMLRSWYPSLGADIAVLGVLEVVLYGVACAWLMRGQAVGPQWLGVRRVSGWMLSMALLLGVALQVPTATLTSWVESISPSAPDELARRISQLAAEGSLRFALLVLIVAVLGPGVEELFFRGILFSRVSAGQSKWGAAVVVAACFTLAHFDPKLWFPLGLVAAVLSYLRVRTASLWPGLVLHMAFNLTTLLLLVKPADNHPIELEKELPNWVIIGGWITVLLLLSITEALARKGKHHPTFPQGSGA